MPAHTTTQRVRTALANALTVIALSLLMGALIAGFAMAFAYAEGITALVISVLVLGYTIYIVLYALTHPTTKDND